MNIEEIKHLFVPVTERPPEENGMYLILPHDATKPYVDYWDKNSFTAFPYKHIYGWLDFSILTTKQRAIDFAEAAVYEEQAMGSSGEGLPFIISNQNTL